MTDQQPEPSHDYQKWTHEMARADAQRSHDRWHKVIDTMNDAAVKASEAALRAAILINGGAAVSVLAFIGGLASKELIKIERLADVATSLLIFAFGVAAATFGIGLSYLTHFLSAAYANSFAMTFSHPYVSKGKRTYLWTWCKRISHGLAFVAGVASLVLFVCGMFAVRNEITHLG